MVDPAYLNGGKEARRHLGGFLGRGHHRGQDEGETDGQEGIERRVRAATAAKSCRDVNEKFW